MTVKPIRDGFATITPYLLVAGAIRLIDFVRDAFNGELLVREARPDGSLMHAEMRVGDSMIMIGEASADFAPMPSSIYLYVPDCDTVYHRALEAGGVSIRDVMNLPSGERYGGVRDPSGNVWWIATHVEDVSPEEQARRWKEFKA
ncbi:MAG: VOC family protein [Gemmatimonadaceae bacterium]